MLMMAEPVCSQTRWDKTLRDALSSSIERRSCRHRGRDLRSISVRPRCDLARVTEKNDATADDAGTCHERIERGSTTHIVHRAWKAKKEKKRKVFLFGSALLEG